MIINPLKTTVALALAVLLPALSGCVDKTNPDTIDKRSVERWNFLIAHQAEKAYDYLTPGFRATQERDVYARAMNNRPLQWKSATFKSKKCDGDRCTAYVDVTYAMKMQSIPGSKNVVESTSAQQETWIRVDGAWFYLPSN